MWDFCRTAESTPAARRRAEKFSIASACCTAMGDVPFVDAAIIIIYANMLGATDMFSMITTSLSPLMIGVFSIAAACFAQHGNYQATIIKVTAISLLLFGLIVMAPWFGGGAVAVLIVALTIFSMCHTIYVNAWFPMLSTFVTDERRCGYFGAMRFSWQLASALFLLVVGFLIGKNPPISAIQLVMLAAMGIFTMKLFFIAKIPRFEKNDLSSMRQTMGIRAGLSAAVENKPLTGFAAYSFILNLAAYGTIPLTTLYLKKWLNAPDNIIVFISSVTLGGMLAGSFCAAPIIRRIGIRNTLLAVHISYAAVNVSLFLLGRGSMPENLLFCFIALALFLFSFMFACSDIAGTSEMMVLSAVGNKVMAMAFFTSFNYMGRGMSRLLTSLIIGSGALATVWQLGGMDFCYYQTLFLVYAACVIFAAALLVVVPAIFPKGEFIYHPHEV
ncbi:MAG: hypothetical protein PHI35_03380 [Victivallaceae bacterium]|nr:hypothetical protein [Victivallaceae bacterium]